MLASSPGKVVSGKSIAGFSFCKVDFAVTLTSSMMTTTRECNSAPQQVNEKICKCAHRIRHRDRRCVALSGYYAFLLVRVKTTCVSGGCDLIAISETETRQPWRRG